MIDYVPPVYGSSLPVVILFALGALLICYYEKKLNSNNNSVSHFLAAKRTQPFWRIAYSLASTSLGAWVLFSVPSYAVQAGYIGLISYSVGCGFTIILPVIFGPLIIEQTKDTAISMNDYVQKRWGNVAKIFITLVCLYNMGIGIISEFTAIGDFFENVVHGSRILIVLLIGSLTSIYIAFGGLSVSVKTDQVQGVIVCIMFLFTVIYVACTFRMKDPRPPLPDYLGATTPGYNSIAAMTISLLASVAFSEAFWQKAWIAQSKQVLQKASLFAGIFIFIIVGTFGFLGWIAAWDGRQMSDQNLAFFGIFGDQVPVGVMMVIAILACVMNESAVDSYQLGITCSVSACFFKNKPLWVTQILVIILNIPLILLSLKNFGIVNLFLSGNLLCTACMGPLLLGQLILILILFLKELIKKQSLIMILLPQLVVQQLDFFLHHYGVVQIKIVLLKDYNIFFMIFMLGKALLLLYALQHYQSQFIVPVSISIIRLKKFKLIYKLKNPKIKIRKLIIIRYLNHFCKIENKLFYYYFVIKYNFKQIQIKKLELIVISQHKKKS